MNNKLMGTYLLGANDADRRRVLQRAGASSPFPRQQQFPTCALPEQGRKTAPRTLMLFHVGEIKYNLEKRGMDMLHAQRYQANIRIQ